MSEFNQSGLFSQEFNPAKLRMDSFAASVLKLFPNGNTPLFALSSQLPKKRAKEIEHGYFTKIMVWPKPVVNNSPGPYDDTATTITVTTTLGIIPGLTFMVPATSEIIKITAVNSATSLEIQRAHGRIAAGNIAHNAQLFLVGNSHHEASDRPVARSIKPEYVPNYTQIVRSAWSMSDTARAAMTEAGYNNVAENRRDCGLMHSSDIEQIFFFGQPKAPFTNPITGKREHTTQGIIDAVTQYASDNVENMASTTDYAELVAAFEPAFEYSSDPADNQTRVGFTDNTGMKVVTDIGRNGTNVQFTAKMAETRFGWRFNQVDFYKGSVMLKNHSMWNQIGIPPGLMVILDMASMAVAYMEGRDVRQEEYGNGKNQDNGIDAMGGSLTSEFATEFMNPRGCAVLNGLTAGVAEGA
jgi:hypothetical protein